ncbi:endonuclease/exonuclease/phosphatase family protein [Streptomyces botrytidirepellens]|uniref:Endonuclease/exonuclease/phosphatase family protein n=1 Tax=Streptomyces botrytidirepellens TaxID=2486417 RepID=A0A3M8ULK2_9ACTN|nr:endonuclease/exonuclease/phosphatase family protein [Streptomyces botrytidirepellens]
MRRWAGRWGADAQGRSAWTRGRVLAGLAVLTAGLLAFHRAVPNSVGRLGSLLEAFLPWLGLVVVVLLGLALLRRSATALPALLLPVAAWTYHFGGLFLPGAPTGADDLLVVQHNVSDENADPAGTARALAGASPDLVALEEMVPAALPVYEKTLAPDYPYHAVRGTVGLWSKHSLTGARLLDIKPRGITESWSRGLRAVVRTPRGEVAAYVAHLPSVRVGASGLASSWRDASAGLLGKAIAADKRKPVILMGDLNGTVDDRGLDPLTSRMNVAERGFALSFPAGFPMARIDQVMARSAAVAHIRTLPATGSDHLPVAARVRWHAARS